MRRLRCNDGWEYRPKVHRMAEMMGAARPWEPVTLPHDALIATERSPDAGPATGYFPAGQWEYRRAVERPDHGGPVILEFEGVYRDATVYVNRSVVAHRPYGYSRFFVPIDHLLEDGENEVRVDATVHEDSRWYPGGGIHRNVWLLEAGPVHFAPDRLEVLTPEVGDAAATVTVAHVVHNRAGSTAVLTLRTELLDDEDRVVATEASSVTAFGGEPTVARQRLHVVDPQLWSPDHPTLYSCRVTLVDGDAELDTDATTFGIRTISVDTARGFCINAEPVLLRGACVHHDNGPIGAATIDRADERRVELLKEAGFNALRSAHNPMSSAMLDACDRLGVLVMDETFDMWATPKTGDDYALRFDDWWEADTEAMVRKDINHPSVVLYSIGNEIPDGSTREGLRRARAQADKVRALDPSRPVTQAVSGLMVAGPAAVDVIRKVMEERQVDEDTGVNTAMSNLADLMNEAMKAPEIDEMTAEAFGLLDVAGYNYMETRFEIDRDLHPNRVIVGSETHPAAIDTGWAKVRDLPNVIGDFTWTGWDYLGEAGIGRVVYGEASAFHGEHPWLTAWCGDLDITGHRRPQSYYREIVFGLRTDPYLAVQRPEHHGASVASGPWAWTDSVGSWTWPDHEGAPVVVEVYADADEVELLVNGESIDRRATKRFRAEFETTYQPGRIEAVAHRAGTEIGRTELVSAEGPLRLTAEADRAEVRADTTDLAYVTLAVSDGRDHVAAVDVEGSGVLQGLASGRPETEERFTDPTVTTFDGRALAVIRPTGPGTITVRAAVDGCEPAEVQITAT